METISKFKISTIKKLNYSLLTNLIDVIVPILTISISLKYLTAEDYGIYLFYYLIYQILIILFQASLSQFFVRVRLENKERYSFNQILGYQFILSLISSFIFCIVFLLYPKQNSLTLYLLGLILFLATFLSFFNLDWYFHLFHKYKTLFLKSCLVKLSLLITIYVMMSLYASILTYCAIVCLFSFLNNIVGYLIVKDKEKISLRLDKLVLSNFKIFLLDSKNFFANSAVGSIYKFADQFLVGALLTNTDLVYLNLLKQILGFATLIPLTIVRYLSPSSINAHKNKRLLEFHRNTFYYYVSLSVLVCVFIVIFGKQIVLLITHGKVFLNSSSLLICTLCSLVASMAIYLDNLYSIPKGMEHVTTKSNLIVLTFFVILIVPCILLWSYIGAFATLLVSELAGLLMMIILHKNISKKTNLI